MALPELFTMYRGDDYTLKITFTDELDAPIDISGWVLKSSMKLSPEMADNAERCVQVDLAPLSGTDAQNGVVYITYPHEQTKDMVAGTYFLDVQKEYVGSVVTILKATATVDSDVTWRTN